MRYLNKNGGMRIMEDVLFAYFIVMEGYDPIHDLYEIHLTRMDGQYFLKGSFFQDPAEVLKLTIEN